MVGLPCRLLMVQATETKGEHVAKLRWTCTHRLARVNAHFSPTQINVSMYFWRFLVSLHILRCSHAISGRDRKAPGQVLATQPSNKASKDSGNSDGLLDQCAAGANSISQNPYMFFSGGCCWSHQIEMFFLTKQTSKRLVFLVKLQETGHQKVLDAQVQGSFATAGVCGLAEKMAPSKMYFLQF